MCGRFVLTSTPQEIEALFGIDDLDPPPPPRYNIAPTQPILLATAGPPAGPGSNLPPRRAMLARWGFLPGWVKDPKDFPLLINARSETAATKNAFRAAMRHRRVLVPASGFFEWKRREGKKSQAYWVRPRDGGLVAFAGLMESWSEPGGSEMDTAAILTTSANAAIAHIHDRMPVIVRPDDFSRWLDCVSYSPADVADIMAPAPQSLMEAIPISDRVNKVANSDPGILEPVTAEPEKPDEAGPSGDGGQMRLLWNLRACLSVGIVDNQCVGFAMSRSVSNLEDLRDELQSQIADLGSELRALRKSAARRSGARYEDVRDGAGELFDEVWSRVSDSLPSRRQIRKQARYAKDTVQEHPGMTAASALVGLAVLGLLASLILRR